MQGWLDEPLNNNGRYLAQLTGKALKDIPFDCCFSSPFVRAVETVKIILDVSGNDIPIITDDRIKEINFGDIEGKKLSVLGDYGNLFFSDPFKFPGFPNGECVQEVCKRTQEFLKELLERKDNSTILIGVHGCALRAMLNYLYDDPSDYWHGHVPYNCAVSIIQANNGVEKLIADDKIYYPSSYAIDYFVND